MGGTGSVESFLEREIQQQPSAIRRVLAADADALERWVRDTPPSMPFVLAARGTSDNAALYARYAFAVMGGRESLLALPSVSTVYERRPTWEAGVLAISQSGRSPDIVQVVAEATDRGLPTLAVTNDPEAPLAAAARDVFALECGPERSVAATKSYTASLAAVARLVGLIVDEPRLTAELGGVAAHVDRALTSPLPDALVDRLAVADCAFVIGRGMNLSTATEAALKLQETTGIVVQGWSPADFAHGPIAAASPATPVIALAAEGAAAGSVIELLPALAARGAPVHLVGPSNLGGVPSASLMALPSGVPEWLSPLVAIVPLQRLAAAVAAAKGIDIDRPFGLTKVTRTR